MLLHFLHAIALFLEFVGLPIWQVFKKPERSNAINDYRLHEPYPEQANVSPPPRNVETPIFYTETVAKRPTVS
ncbi:hypothetical protein [Oryzicola mucosus]|uniref:Uncharacterized protein n=1 Tax=Oryzicola mucosus TaxID=2767425 RepID=A0A8J6U103_9HYPH|nr:hypothetical protein [Oryzicola mucosus]MBD0413548.1 hypothetical protein [Oryzicola mucosus]